MRNFTLLFLTVVLSACTKDDDGLTPYNIDYRAGKMYRQTFYANIGNHPLDESELIAISTNNRLAFSVSKSSFELYNALGPSEQALDDLVKYWNTSTPSNQSYYLVADFDFFYSQHSPATPQTLNIYEHFKLVGKWRLVLAKEQQYTVNDKPYARLVITKQIKSYNQPKPPSSEGTVLDNSITDYQYGCWYLQTFLLQASWKDQDMLKRDAINLQTKFNDLAPINLIRKLQALTDYQPPYPDFPERFWETSESNRTSSDPYSLSADFLFLSDGKLSPYYLQRKSDWLLVRRVFDGEDYTHTYWIEDDGTKFYKQQLFGKWQCKSFNLDGEALTAIEFLDKENCICTFETGKQTTGPYHLNQFTLSIQIAGDWSFYPHLIEFNKTWDVIYADEGSLLIRTAQ